MNEKEATHQTYTIIVETQRQEEFEKELEYIRRAYGKDSINDALIQLIFDFRELLFKAEFLDKFRDFIKELEASKSEILREPE